MKSMLRTTEPLVLAIETCTRAGSVSLARGKKVLAALIGDESSSRSTDLIDIIDRALDGARAKLADLDLFAASIGPGSFTGLRIGLATVKALAVCVERPCAAISTLAAIARAAGDSEATLAILPAGRGEVYAQMFWVRGERVEALDRESHMKPARLLRKYAGIRVLKFAGEGAQQHFETLTKCMEEKGIRFVRTESVGSDGWSLAVPDEPLANSVAALALCDYQSGKLIGAEALRANYVRPSDAEINERWQQQNL